MKKFIYAIISLVISAVMIALPLSASAFTVGPSYAKNITVSIYNLVCFDENLTVLANKNTSKKFFTGSFTMLMTALTAYDHLNNLDAEFAVSAEAILDISGTGAYGCDLLEGEIMTARDHYYRCLLGSRSDSCSALASESTKSIPAFIEEMNNKAKALGMKNTNFVNCTGLYSEEQYTTAEDLTILAAEFLKNTELTKICTAMSYEIPFTNKRGLRQYYTNNLLVQANSKFFYTYADGLKYCSNDYVGKSIISTATYENKKYICVTIGGNAYAENSKGQKESLHDELVSAKNLYRWAFLTLAYKNTSNTDLPIAEIPVTLSLDDYISLYPEKNIFLTVPKDSAVTYNIILKNPTAEAPVSNGEILGYAEIVCAGEIVGEVNLVSHETVLANPMLYIWGKFLKIISTPLFWTATVGAVIIALLIVFAVKRYKRKKKIKNRRNNYRKF